MDINLNSVFRALSPNDNEIMQEKGLYINNRYNRDYTLYIDSKDRDISKYSSPFHFAIEFDSVGTKNINFPVKIDELNFIYFKQVFIPIKLLPKRLLNSKYFILRIKELNMQYQYSSSIEFNSNTDIILFNVGYSNHCLILDSKMGIPFNDELRPSITKLTLQFLDFDLKPLIVSHEVEDEDEDCKTLSENIFIDLKIGINEKTGLNKVIIKD